MLREHSVSYTNIGMNISYGYMYFMYGSHLKKKKFADNKLIDKPWYDDFSLDH